MLLSISMLVLAYGLGSIPFGLILAKYVAKEDITSKGSGNIGATNVTRVCGKKLGGIVLFLDMVKGMLATGVAYALGGVVLASWSALFAVIGHIFPYWLKFKGGKGVATAFGVMVVLYWPLALVMATCWLAVFAMLRISSVSAIVTMIILIVLSWVYAPYGTVLPIIVIGALVIARHKDNVFRLLKGEEK